MLFVVTCSTRISYVVLSNDEKLKDEQKQCLLCGRKKAQNGP
jgi:hypothetical protein